MTPRSRKPRAPATDGEATLERLEQQLGHRFARRELIERALVHRSWAYESGSPGRDSESMEFLGDAVLGLAVSRLLFERMGREQVGELARARAFLVSEESLAAHARALDLGRHLRLGRGEEKMGGRDKDSLLADALEAVLAAVYLDAGFPAAFDLVARIFGEPIGRLRPGGRTSQDFKTDLQERLQGAGLPVPIYVVSHETGPAHRKSFAVDLRVADRTIAHGTGSSKKAAEQMAAQLALSSIDTLLAELTGRSADPTGSS